MHERRKESRRKRSFFVLPGRAGRRIEDLEFSILTKLVIFTVFILVLCLTAIFLLK